MGRPLANQGQLHAIATIADRIIQEMEDKANSAGVWREPLRRLLHGGPGTGKSHVTLLRELFGELGWQQGVHYQVVALQAVMAQLISGDTIHHACGIKAFKKGAEYDDGIDSQQIIAKRVLQ